MFFFITSSHTFFYSSQNNFKNQIVWEVLVGEVLVVGMVVGSLLRRLLRRLLERCWLGRCWLEQYWLGYKIHSLWREVLEGWKGEEVREGTCS